MPALVAFGRTWEFGSDDLFFPAFVSSLIRIVALTGILGATLYFRDALFCQSPHLLAGLSIALLCMILVTILTEASIAVFSARGSIVNTKPRKPVSHLLHFRAVLFVLEVTLLIVGTVFAFLSQEELSSNVDCPDLAKAVLVVHISVAANWILLFLLVVAILLYLDPCHCYSAKVNYSHVFKQIQRGLVDDSLVETQWRLNHTAWEKRFKVMCCITGRDESHHAAYREVAEIFAHLFCDTNLVWSDIVAGFVLLQREQLKREKQPREGVKERDVEADNVTMTTFDFNNEEDCEVFKNLHHFIKYAIGIYTWPIYVYMNPLCGLCKLCCSLKCGSTSDRYTNVSKDNSCMCHLRGLQRITEVDEEDIVYASFENSLFKVPFVVCLDHEMKAVVISFRGTLSFSDVVTDLTANMQPMELPDFPNFLVHKGMLKTVQWVIEELKKEERLKKAFKNQASSYKLVIVGHSLGSGCACILGILLREEYPDLKCYCYSPTGALLNEAAAIFTEDFVTSITLGNDLVARMNFPNIKKLRGDLVNILESCHKPKCQLLAEGLLETLLTCFGKSVTFDPGTTPRQRLVPQTEIDCEEEENISEPCCCLSRQQRMEITPLIVPNLSSLSRPVRATDVSPQNLSDTQRVEVPLYLPGRVVHIVHTDDTKRCFFASRQVTVTWSSRKRFHTIGVSPDMFRDHFPDVLCNAMNKVWNEKMREIN